LTVSKVFGRILKSRFELNSKKVELEWCKKISSVFISFYLCI